MYRYGRVVLVGHSLGSVIAYDILKHYWQEVNGKMRVDPEQFAAVEVSRAAMAWHRIEACRA